MARVNKLSAPRGDWDVRIDVVKKNLSLMKTSFQPFLSGICVKAGCGENVLSYSCCDGNQTTCSRSGGGGEGLSTEMIKKYLMKVSLEPVKAELM